MFRLLHRRRPVAVVAQPAPPPEAVPPPSPSPAEAGLLRQWLQLAELQRRAATALAGDINATAADVATSTLDLSERFQELATTAQAQTERVDAVVAIARSIEVDGTAVPLAEATGFIQDVLGRVVDTVVTMTETARTMAGALDEAARQVDAAERCLGRIAEVTRQTRFLALNATIEASRTGARGGAAEGDTFAVIATEIRDLARATGEISGLVHTHISAVAAGVREGRRVLQGIAGLDLADHLAARRRLDALMAGLVRQNHAFTAVLGEASGASQALSAVIDGLITGIQFQDRTQQVLDHVVATLRACGAEAAQLQDATCAATAIPPPEAVDAAVLARVLQVMTLSAARQRFRAVVTPEAPGAGDAPDEGEAVELF